MPTTAFKPGTKTRNRDDDIRYTLPVLDRTGVMFGYGFGEVAILGVVAMLVTALVQLGVTPWFYIPLMGTAMVATRRLAPHGLQIIEYWPILRSRLRHRRKPAWQATTPWDGTQGDLPQTLTGIALGEIQVDINTNVGTIKHPDGTTTYVTELGAAPFLLKSNQGQASVLNRWGRLLGASAADSGSEIRHLAFTVMSSQGSPQAHATWIETAQGNHVPQVLRDDYRSLVRKGVDSSTGHRILLSTTLGPKRTSKESDWGTTTPNAAEEQSRIEKSRIQAVTQSVRTIKGTLATMGWSTIKIADRATLQALLGECVDPETRSGRAAAADRTVNALTGITTTNQPPTAVKHHPYFVAINEIDHRTFWVQGWPNHPLDPDWLVQLLSQVVGERRVTTFFRTVPPSESIRDHEREMEKHDAQIITAEEKGKRVPLKTRQAQMEAVERGEQLIDGYAMVETCSLITVSAASQTDLRDRSDAIQALAVSAGLRITPLDHGHALGWAATTPFGPCPLKPRSNWN